MASVFRDPGSGEYRYLGMTSVTVVVGWMVGTDLGLIAGLAWDEATANDFVSNAMLTIPLGGLVGSVFMGWLALRLTRPRSAVERRA